MDTLEQFIQNNPASQELKRALAVQMSQRGHSYREIRDVLQVSIGLITHCTQCYEASGVEGLKLNYWGTQGYLSAEQKQELFEWLAQKEGWTLEAVMNHIEDTYQVVYRSPQSYYTLLRQAGFSWKKAQPVHPDQDEPQIEKKNLKLWGYWSSGDEKLRVERCE